MNENLLDCKNFKMFGSKQMESIAKKIKIVVFDFDGVFTDNSVYTTEDGKEIIKNSKYDSMGISKANRRQNFELDKVPYIVFSSETNPTVTKRCEKIKIDHHTSGDKLKDLGTHTKTKHINLDEIAFIGNDINDMGCLLSVGMPIIVPDCSSEVVDELNKKLTTVFVTKNSGGNGAVREVIDYFERIKIPPLTYNL